MKKRGISGIVVTVLIVLLALAGVSVVWSFTKPAIERAADAGSFTQQCFSTEVTPKNCGVSGSGTYTVTSAVELTRGKAEQIIISFEKSNGQIDTTNITAPANQYETALGQISNIAASDFPLKIRAYATIDANGEEHMCTETQVEVLCKQDGSYEVYYIGGGSAESNAPITGGAVCGNGQLEAGEQCDSSASPVYPTNADTCGEVAPGYSSVPNLIDCSPQCVIIADACYTNARYNICSSGTCSIDGGVTAWTVAERDNDLLNGNPADGLPDDECQVDVDCIGTGGGPEPADS